MLETPVDGLSFAETPRWYEGRLWISDFHTHRVLAISESGHTTTIAEVPRQPSGIGFLPDGGELSEHADLSGLVPGICA